MNKIIRGDCLDELPKLDSNSIDLIITSPPYWNLKDYNHLDQIGYNDDYPEYINKLKKVFTECYRVLKDGCRMCINIMDIPTSTKLTGRHRIIPLHSDVINICTDIQFDYMGCIFWHKFNNIRSSGGSIMMGSYLFPRNGVVKVFNEFILIFKKLGKPEKVSKEIKEQSIMTNEEWKQYFYGNWHIAGIRQNKNHSATFPKEIPHRLIKMYSFIGETILDPFVGSGTTMKVANKLNRNSIGIEINYDYCDDIKNYFDCMI